MNVKQFLTVALFCLMSVIAMAQGKNSKSIGNTLRAGEKITTQKQHLTSANGKYYISPLRFNRAHTLVMQTDGNLVAYSQILGTAEWDTRTSNVHDKKYADPKYKAVKVVLENDGNLYLYTASGDLVLKVQIERK